MRFFYRPAIRKRVAGCLLLLTVSELAFPSVSYALTSGPSQPEFSSFEPVSTNQLVDEFSGDFTYNIPVINIPGPNGSDYPLSLSYHSGATSEEEASWVGYGWTLNPGAITRNTRGFPDDYNQSAVAYYNKMPTNWTATAGVGAAGLEVFGKDMPVNLSYALRYNNYQGFGFNRNVGISLGKGIISLGYNATDGGQSFSASVSPVTLLSRAHDALGALHKSKETPQVEAGENATANKEHKHKRFNGSSVTLIGGNHGFFTYGDYNRSTHAASYSGGSMNVSVGLQVNAPPVPAGLTFNVFGSYSWQTNTEQEDLQAYGYLYSAEADKANGDNKNNGIRDYYTEKETSYNKRDNFLGMPFNNADIFAVSGEGVGGSFRLYHDQVGEFVPNYKASKIIIGNLSPEISVGTTFGLGADFGGGWQEFSEGPWERKETDRASFSTAATGTDNVFFRFANDLGGGTSPTVISDEPVTAQVGRTNPGKTGLQNELRQTAAHSRASFIAYHTIKDVVKNIVNSYGGRPEMREARLFSQRKDLPTTYSALDQSAICEMAISTSSGGRYLYGLPVLSANENNLQYNIEQQDKITQNYIAQVTSSASLDSRTTKLGETRNTPYASSFPLTEIQTSDYVDRTLDGPTPDDFGGYTRFNYDKVYDIGTYPADNSYHWRTPYNGLLFRANSLSDPEDDLGSVSYGRKDVVYLSSVQTKTHTAIFVRSPRDDARDALSEDGGLPSRRSGSENPQTGAGYKSMDKLSRIDLYNNSDLDANGKPLTGKFPIKSVHFSYSYELFQAGSTSNNGVPNALIDSNTGKRKGKLTLTRIWFEYQGIPTKVSPYTFSYNYPSYSTYPAKYTPAGAQAVTTSAEDLSSKNEVAYYDKLSAGAQNPVYDPLNLDAWGNYCANGPARAQNMQPWLDQRDLWDNGGATASPTWDPAAWQLKVITLPTGGQIHVQYEQDDYAYVQNKPVHAMASLLPTGSGDNIFQLNAEELGLTEDSEKQATVDALKKQYQGTGRKIFFKFLYSLVGATTPTLQPLSTNAEYITGYTTVKDARFVSGNPSKIELELDAPGYTLPKQVCQNFLLTQRAGKLGGNKFTANKATPMQAVRDLVAWYMVNNKFGSQCGTLNPALSYFRIPLVKPKKGGGLRVKRLLTFDQTGLDGTPVLYGSEYSYRMRTNDGKIISSGVATTEPGAMREENILVDYLPREGQSLFSRAVSGLDRKQAEGPLGESLLPGPSVGYSRVVVRNIHSGRTTPGFSISEFFTARDYPMQVKYTSLKPDNQFRLIPLLLFTDQVNNTYATQGYSFLLNNMHGQVRRRATYPGNYPGHDVLSTNLPSPTTEQKYDYYQPARLPDADAAVQPGDYLPVVAERSSPTQQQLNPTQPLYPGREVDITSAQKAVKDNMVDINFETDTDVAIFFWPIFYATVFPCITRSQSELYTHVTTKVIRYPAVIRRIETTQDGIKHTTENIAFDQLSGQPVQTRETDEFKGGYVHETTQAAWVRPELGAKWDRENLLLPAAAGTVQLTSGSDGATWLKFSGSACDGLAKLTRGDQLRIVLPSDADEGNNMLYFADAPDFLNKQVRVYPVKLPFVATASAVPPATGAVTAVQVLTSGRRNQLSAPAASTVYHGTDYTTLSSVGPFTTTTKYAPSTFSSAIASWLGTSTSTTASFSSGASSYDHINLSAYANKLPVGCVKDPSDVTISNVVLKKQTLNGKVTVSLVSCAVSCENGGSAFTLQN